MSIASTAVAEAVLAFSLAAASIVNEERLRIGSTSCTT